MYHFRYCSVVMANAPWQKSGTDIYHQCVRGVGAPVGRKNAPYGTFRTPEPELFHPAAEEFKKSGSNPPWQKVRAANLIVSEEGLMLGNVPPARNRKILAAAAAMDPTLQRKLELDARGQRREKNYMAKNLREIRHKQAENRRKKQVEDGPVPDRPSTANTTGKYAHVKSRFREQLSPQRAGDDENSGHEAHPREGKSHSTVAVPPLGLKQRPTSARTSRDTEHTRIHDRPSSGRLRVEAQGMCAGQDTHTPRTHTGTVRPQSSAGALPSYLTKRKEEWKLAELAKERHKEEYDGAPRGHRWLSDPDRRQQLRQYEAQLATTVQRLQGLGITNDSTRVRRVKEEIELEIRTLEGKIRDYSRNRVSVPMTKS